MTAANNIRLDTAIRKVHMAQVKVEAAFREYRSAVDQLNGCFKGSLNTSSIARDKRRIPRSKLAHDSEVRGFVEARLGNMTLKEIARQVASTFSPERRVSVSAIHRWDQLIRSSASS